MAVRNQNSRQSRNHTIAEINGVNYYIQLGSFQTKDVVYTAKKRLIDGKISAPKEMIKSSRTILVMCNGGNNYEFSTLIKK